MKRVFSYLLFSIAAAGTTLHLTRALAQEAVPPTAAAGIGAVKEEAPAAEGAKALAGEREATPAAIPLDYMALMRLEPKVRRKLLDDLPAAERDNFLATLTGSRKAVLATDPNDCGRLARLTRYTLATGEPEESFVASTTKEIGKSATSGLMNMLLPGLGDTVSTAAQLNEINKYRRGYMEYRDVCDLSPSERAALFSAQSAANKQNEDKAKEGEGSLLDRASRFFGR